MPKADPVVIVGGGISGLAAAYELTRRGVPFDLFERSHHLGGVIRTENVNGFVIDAGPDSLLVQKPAAIELCRELGLGDRLVPTLPPRTAYVFRAGRLHPLPEASVLGIPTRLGPLATTSLLSAAGKVRMALELTTPASDDTDDESVASFFRRRFGDESVAYLAEPLLAGIHAGDVDRLSMQALFPRLVAAEREHGSVIRRFRALRAAQNRPRDGLFRSLPGGIGELTEALLATLPDARLHTAETVEEVSGPAPYHVRLSSGRTVTAAQVVLATPGYVTAEIVSDLDAELAHLCASIPYTSTATVVLSYPATSVGHSLEGTGFVVPRVETALSMMAGSWVSSKWPGRAPEGQVLLRGFVGGARDPHALEQSDEELIASTHRDFGRLLHLSTGPVVTRVYRWSRVNPQHEVGHLQKLAAIDARLAEHPGLQVAGSAFRGVGIPDCVGQGRTAGKVAAEARAG